MALFVRAAALAGFTAVVTIIAPFGAARARADVMAHPAWSVAVSRFAAQQKYPTLDARTVGVVTLILGPVSDGLLGIDRATGRVLWRRRPPIAKRKPGAMTAGDETHSWYFVGSDGDLAILKVGKSRFLGQGANPYSMRWELVAIDARTGEQRWWQPLKDNLYGRGPLGVYGCVLVMRDAPGQSTVHLRRARTGDPIDPQTPAGREALDEAVRRVGHDRLLLCCLAPVFLDLKHGAATAYAGPGGYGIEVDGEQGPAAFQAGDRIYTIVDTDDGGVGHSSWPKYLVCLRASDSREIWRYRKDVVWDYKLEQPKVGSGSRLLRAIVLPAAQTIVAQEAWSSWLHGLRLADGRPLWHRNLKGEWIAGMAVCGERLLLLANRENIPEEKRTSSRLLLLDPATGRVVRSARCLASTGMRLDGGMVYVWGSMGAAAYPASAWGECASAVSGKPIRRRSAFH